MDTVADDPGLDTVFGLLSETRSRYLLYHVLDRDCLNVDTVSRQIVAWEQGETVDTVSDERIDSVSVSLVQTHLPRLADHDLLRYDHRSGDIAIGDDFEAVRETVERARDVEGIGPAAETSARSFLYSDPLVESTNTDQ